MHDPLAFTLPESLDPADFMVATYLYQGGAQVDILQTVRAIAETQSCGTWVSLGQSSELIRERHLGRVVSLWEAPDYENPLPEGVARRTWIFQIAYPIHNFGSSFPLMLTTALGEVSVIEGLRLLDLHFPPAFTSQFGGPRFGVPGLRQSLGVQGRPLLLSIIKPPLGLTPEQSAAEFYQSALGGADLVKDDELLVSHPWSELTERVRAHQQAAQAAFEQTGQKTLYFVNITDRPDRLVENALRAAEAGATGLMVNYLTVGISALSMLAEHPQLNLPILAHLNFAGAIYTSSNQGASSHLVLGKLPRLAGADLVVYPGSYGKFSLQRHKYLRIAQALTSPLHHLRPAWPAPGGGIHPGLVPLLTGELGQDHILAAGGAIYGHPHGPAAGARAFRQAIAAASQGVSLEQAAQQAPELALALELWGGSQHKI